MSLSFTPPFKERLGASLNPVIILIATTLICLVFFADKAFHIDDPLFLWSAQQIQNDPTDFYGFKVNWTGSEMSMADITKNPPLTSYFIAVAAYFAGWSETALHLAFLIPALAAVLGTYYLAQQLCSLPLIAALAALMTPIFLVSSTNVMCDTMMLAFWVWAVALWLRGMERNDYRLLLFSSILIALASLTKFFGISLIPLLFAYSLIKRRGLGKEQLFLLIPIAFFLGYEWVTYSLYGQGHFSSAQYYAKSARLTLGEPFYYTGLVGLAFTGGCLATVLFFAPLFLPRKILLGGVCLFSVVFLVIFFLEKAFVPNTHLVVWPTRIQFDVFVLSGFSLILLAFMDLWKRKDPSSVLLFLWVLGTLVFATCFNWTMNGRSVLPMAPAVGILIARNIGEPAATSYWKLSWPLIPSLILALLVTWSDYHMANNARGAANELIQKYGKNSETIWFTGHWGFQYYMESGGAKPLIPSHSPVQNGDIAVVPKYNVLDQSFAVPDEHLQWKRKVERPSFPWLAAMNFSLGAGLYSYAWGPLPFAFGQVPPDQYTVFKLRIP